MSQAVHNLPALLEQQGQHLRKQEQLCHFCPRQRGATLGEAEAETEQRDRERKRERERGEGREVECVCVCVIELKGRALLCADTSPKL